MKNSFLVITLSILFFAPKVIFAQAPNLGIVASFFLYSTAGAIESSGATALKGNIGNKNAGVMHGLSSSNVNGNIYNQIDSVTTQCERDLQSAYNQLKGTAATLPHAAIEYGNETLLAGVYDHTVAEACNGVGTLILDGEGDSTSIFVIKINGAFTTSASFTVKLINKVCPCNVYWLIEGALTLGANNDLNGTFIVNNGAIVTGAGCKVMGRIITTTGAITISALEGFAPTENITNYWTGAAGTSNWFTDLNWTTDVPNGKSSTLIPASINVGRFFPLIDTGVAKVANLTIQKGASIKIKSVVSATSTTAKLMVNTAIINLGILDACEGTLELNGVSIQSLPSNLCLKNSIANLIISNNTILTGPQNVTGKLSFGGSNITLQTNGFLTLKSTAAGTAQLADITNGGKDSLNVIAGTVVIERFIPAKRAWRLMSVPLTGDGAQTINASWQEGANAGSLIQNPNPGYGMQITGGDSTNGFDKGVNANPSLKVYDNVSNTFIGLPLKPGTNAAITTYPAYFLFIRGDRSTNLQQGIGAAISNTTLRMQGHVNTGANTIPVNAKNFTLISNPYPAAINFHTITKNNVGDQFYLWDPKQGTLGGYICFSWNSSDNKYEFTSSASNLSQYIASGEAFFVKSLDSTISSSVTINETDKNNSGSDNVFRPMTTFSSMRVNLSGINTTDSSVTLIDGVLTSFADNNNNGVDNNDVQKIYNMAENICISRDKKILAIEKRATVNNSDTSFIKLYLLKKQKYQLSLTAGSMDNSGLSAILKDNYDSTINNTNIAVNGATNIIPFTVNTDAGSFAADRFSIVYTRSLMVLPVKFETISVVKQQKNALLTFQVSSEDNMKEYVVETAQTSNSFTDAAYITSKLNNGGLASYNWVDVNATAGIHYYRVKAISNGGKITYSAIVTMMIEKDNSAASIKAFPTIIVSKKISYTLINISAGSYNMQILNMAGQLIKSFSISHNGNSGTQYNCTIDGTLATGKYVLQLSGKSNKYSTAIIKD